MSNKPASTRKKPAKSSSNRSRATALQHCEMAPQLAIRDPRAPHYTMAELAMHARGCKSFGEVMVKCASLAGFDVKAEQVVAGMDKSRWSRIASGQEGIYWGQVEFAIKVCGNPLPLVWIGQQLEFDPLTFRLAETKLERDARLKDERIASLELANKALATHYAEQTLELARLSVERGMHA